MIRSYYNTRSKGSTALLVGALSASSVIAGSGLARAEGFMDFLFGTAQQRSALPSSVTSYAEPSAPAVTTAPIAPHHPKRIADRSVAFCVRLCDGRYFPLDHISNATAVETCQAVCPATKTKVFFGSQIDRAVAREGARYAELANAYVYRSHLVPTCTCNGKDAFGLAAIDAKSDLTLQPGDIVSTKDGLVTYSGAHGKTAVFTPINASTVKPH